MTRKKILLRKRSVVKKASRSLTPVQQWMAAVAALVVASAAVRLRRARYVHDSIVVVRTVVDERSSSVAPVHHFTDVKIHAAHLRPRVANEIKRVTIFHSAHSRSVAI